MLQRFGPLEVHLGQRYVGPIRATFLQGFPYVKSVKHVLSAPLI